jgi:hypothetical protein
MLQAGDAQHGYRCETVMAMMSKMEVAERGDAPPVALSLRRRTQT